MKRLKVLLVDDEGELVLTLAERLENRGIAAKAVQTGDEALACFRKEHYDIVMADLKMPGIGGLKLKGIMEEEQPEIKVILVTGQGALDLEDGSFSAQEQEVLMKPFSLDTLMKRINELLDHNEEVD